MIEKSNIRCETPSCINAIQKYGEIYHRVYSHTTNGADACCEQCGAVHYPDGWKSVCEKCKRDVLPGELVGLFVPHLCKECEKAVADEDVKRGNICGMCREPRSRCCC